MTHKISTIFHTSTHVKRADPPCLPGMPASGAILAASTGFSAPAWLVSIPKGQGGEQIEPAAEPRERRSPGILPDDIVADQHRLA